MNKSDIEQMKEYGITGRTKTIYTYKQHHYDRLNDALSYAQIDTKRNPEHASNKPGNIKPFLEK